MSFKLSIKIILTRNTDNYIESQSIKQGKETTILNLLSEIRIINSFSKHTKYNHISNYFDRTDRKGSRAGRI